MKDWERIVKEIPGGWDDIISGTGDKTALIQEGLTNNDKVLLDGQFTVSSTLLFKANQVIGIPRGTILTAADGLDSAILANANQASHDECVWIGGGGIIKGNSANQTATARGIEIIHAADVGYLTNNFPMVVIEGLTVYDTFGAGVFVQFLNSPSSTIRIRDVSSYANVAGSGGELGHSLYLYAVYDSHVEGGLFDSYDTGAAAIHLTSTSMCKVHPYYVNNRVNIVNSNQLDFSCASMDLSRNADLISCAGLQYSSIHDVAGRVTGDGDANTHNLIELASTGGTHSIHNRFSNIYAGRRGGAGTRTFKYAAEEVDANQDYNIYGGVDGLDCVSGAVRQLGVNGKPRANPKDDIVGAVILV